MPETRKEQTTLNIVTLVKDLEELEAHVRAEELREATFRQEINRSLSRLESKIGQLESGLARQEKRLPPPVKLAYRELTLRMVQVFAFSWLASFIALAIGLGGFPNMTMGRAAAWAALVAGMAAVLKVAQASVTADEAPFPGKGIGRPRSDSGTLGTP